MGKAGAAVRSPRETPGSSRRVAEIADCGLQAGEEAREARGIRGQREFPQKNRGTGLSGEPESPSPALGWCSQFSRAASHHKVPREGKVTTTTGDLSPLANGSESTALRLLPSDLE